MAPAALENLALETATMRRVTIRIVPFLMVCYFIAFVDRVNCGLRRAPDEQGPRALAGGVRPRRRHLLPRLFPIRGAEQPAPGEGSARGVWIARIMITWGLLAGAHGPGRRARTRFYLLRFLLGAAEAGFFPGVILYLTYWFPAAVPGADRRRCSWSRFRCRASSARRSRRRSSKWRACSACMAGNGCSSSKPCRRSCSAWSRSVVLRDGPETRRGLRRGARVAAASLQAERRPPGR